jgi:hypothetical protein
MKDGEFDGRRPDSSDGGRPQSSLAANAQNIDNHCAVLWSKPPALSTVARIIALIRPLISFGTPFFCFSAALVLDSEGADGDDGGVLGRQVEHVADLDGAVGATVLGVGA